MYCSNAYTFLMVCYLTGEEAITNLIFLSFFSSIFDFILFCFIFFKVTCQVQFGCIKFAVFVNFFFFKDIFC